MPDDNRTITAPAQGGAPATFTGFNLMALIERALTDPSFPAETIQGLFAMAEKAQARQDLIAFNNAIAEVQRRIRPVVRNKLNPQTRSKYAPYEVIMDMLQPLLDEYGLRISFGGGAGTPPEGMTRIVMKVALGAYVDVVERDIYTDFVGARGNAIAMTKQQMSGGAQTYGMRYMVTGYFNVTSVDEDDDGEGARDAEAAARKAEAERQRAATQGGTKAAAGAAAGKTTGPWNSGLAKSLAALKDVADLDRFTGAQRFSEWLKTTTPDQRVIVDREIAARRIELEAEAAAARVAEAAHAALTAGGWTDDAAKEGGEAAETADQPTPETKALLDRVASCQTQVALDSLLDAPEFTGPLSKLTWAGGELVTLAIKQRSAALGAA